jgi:4-amino-4-deoxychorismate lyase
MSLLFETIRISDGHPENLELHEERLNRSKKLLTGNEKHISLTGILKIPDFDSAGVFRCRVVYDTLIRSVEYSPYTPAVIRTLKLVWNDHLDYSLKYLDRTALQALIDKKIADDVLIVKNGTISDASYANIIFTDGQTWVTPDIPLLPGTMRQKLLKEGLVRSARITPADLDRFTHFKLINAMLGFSFPARPISDIF